MIENFFDILSPYFLIGTREKHVFCQILITGNSVFSHLQTFLLFFYPFFQTKLLIFTAFIWNGQRRRCIPALYKNKRDDGKYIWQHHCDIGRDVDSKHLHSKL